MNCWYHHCTHEPTRAIGVDSLYRSRVRLAFQVLTVYTWAILKWEEPTSSVLRWRLCCSPKAGLSRFLSMSRPRRRTSVKEIRALQSRFATLMRRRTSRASTIHLIWTSVPTRRRRSSVGVVPVVADRATKATTRIVDTRRRSQPAREWSNRRHLRTPPTWLHLRQRESVEHEAGKEHVVQVCQACRRARPQSRSSRHVPRCGPHPRLALLRLGPRENQFAIGAHQARVSAGTGGSTRRHDG